MFTSYDVERSPLVRVALPFMAGIILFLFFPLNPDVILTTLFVFSILAYISISVVKKWRNHFIVSRYISFFAVLIICFSGYYYTSAYRYTENKKEVTDGLLIAEVVSQPQQKDRSVKTEAEIIAIKSNNVWEHAEGKVLLYIEKCDSALNIGIGDRIIFEPVLKDVENKGNPGEFDYKKYLAYNLIYQQAYLKTRQYTIIKNENSFSLKRMASEVRKEIIGTLRKYGVKGDELAVISALSVGYKDELDSEIRQSYSASGAMHVLAVSGLHVGIIYVVFSFLLGFLNRKKWMKLLKCVLLIMILWFYAFLSGLSPSISRAALMFSFVIIGQQAGRYTNIYNTLAASAFILLLLNPFHIASVGFQFSYLAVIGIVYFYPKIYGLVFVRNKWADKIWSLVCVSVAAQLVTAPLGIYYFHQFPNYFLLTNLIVIPAATIIIYLVLLLLAFSWFPFVAQIVASLTSEITGIMNEAVAGIEHLPGAVSNGIPSGILFTVLIYILIFSVAFFLIYRRFLPLLMSLLVIMAMLITSFAKDVTTKNEREIFVYNIPGHLALNLIDGNKNYLFTTLGNENISYKYLSMNNWVQKGLDREKTIPLKKLNNQFLLSNLFYLSNPNLFYKNNCFAFYDTEFALIRDKLNADAEIKSRLKLDFVILTGNAGVTISEILNMFDTENIVISSSNSKYRVEKWTKEAVKYGVNIFNVQEKGAFYMKIS
jgi:competence protein ComEC